MSDPDHLTARGGVWHFQRRVPTEYQAFDDRSPVRLSTKVKVARDRKGTKAARVAERMNADLEAFWRASAEGRGLEARQTYEDAMRRARAYGLDYLEASEAAGKPLHDMMGRIETLMQGHRADDPATTAAVLGGVPKPVIMLSSIFTEFEVATRDERIGYSPKQQRRWTSGKERAIEIFIEQMGDGERSIAELTRADALKFRRFWQSRVIDEGIDPGTANKNITHVGGMFNRVNELHQLGLDNVFAGIRLKKGKANPRRPFDVQFVQQKILADGALTRMNDEARRILFVMADTGARPSEIANLTEANIRLDTNIPHICIEPDGRVLKTEQSRRKVPLVGAALAALRAMPKGFPRYRDNEDSLSAALNSFLDDNGFLGENQTVYSLRHTFKDRLKAARAPEEMIDELMGHLIDKPKYGEGYGLDQKLAVLLGIAFVPPAAV